MDKLNCWDHKKCGREPGGAKTHELGVCPSSTEKRIHGLNSGKNGGRVCWAVAGTLCGGTAQGTFCTKFASCMKCEFFKLVTKEEGVNFADIGCILAKLKESPRRNSGDALLNST